MDEILYPEKTTVPPSFTSNESPAIRDHFPFPEIRKSQEAALSLLEHSIKDGKKFTIIEAPTGSGKSGIGIAAGSWAKTWPKDNAFHPGAHLVTPQKILQAQMMHDFEDRGLVELKGKANYWCSCHNVDCDTGSVINNAGHKGDDRQVCEGCPYKQAKRDYIGTPLGTVNFAYYLNETQYAGEIPNRNLLVLDESHNLESCVLGHVDTVISRTRAEELGIGEVPGFKPGENTRCKDWLHNTFLPACQDYMGGLENDVKEARYNNEMDQLVKLAKKLDAYDKFVCRLNRFMRCDDLRDWLCYTTETTKYNRQEPELLIKPLTATLFADEILFSKAKHNLIMSATLLHFPTFMRNLGISKSEAYTMACDSEFPVENRRIHFKPVGNMRYEDKAQTLPKMVRMVERIMDKYPNYKGIVHTHTYDICKATVEYLRGTSHRHRIITHTSSNGSRNQALIDHIESKIPTFLFTPSMQEGVDLKDDLSRVQVIMKVPYPSLDIYVKARMRRDPDWYNWCAALNLVQSSGRSIRSKTDWAITFILDSGFSSFYSRCEYLFPAYWRAAVS